MTINGGIFVLQQVYNKQISKVWPITSPIVKVPVTNLTTIDEGNSVVVNINTFDYIGQTLYWTISGVSGTINSSDFSAISGSFVVQSNNFGNFTITSTVDETTEGTESFVVQIRTDSTSGAIRATSDTITINDTSVKILGNYGWYAGGFSTAHTSTVDRISFASDTSTASVRGPLDVPNYSAGVLSNKDYAWVTGGDKNPGGVTSSVSRITFNSDLSALSTRGSLSSIRSGHAAVNVYSPAGTPSSGYLGGGSPGPTSRVDRITYATDTATASARGPLSLARFGLAAAASTTIAWFGGGSGTPSFLSRVDRITFSSDTAAATSRGPLSVSTRRLAASTNITNGWFAGGDTPALTSRVSRVTYSSDTVTASIRGPLTSAKSGLAAVNQSSVYGFYAGGSIGASKITTVDRITHSSDTVTATSRGPISSSRYLFDGNNGSITG
jgi:hypothetical protein